METAQPKKCRPKNLNGTLEQCLSSYEPVMEQIGELIQAHWSWNHWIPCIEEEIRATMIYVFTKSYQSRDDHPGLFPPPPELLYSRTWWALVRQWAPRESIQRHHVMMPYDTIEHWDPGNPECIVAFNEQSIGRDRDSIFPYEGPPDMLDFWYLGLSTAQIGMIYNLTDRTVRKKIKSFYEAIDSAIKNNPPDTLRPLPSPVPRPCQGRKKPKSQAI